MWCGGCNKHLSECTCENLLERLEEIEKDGRLWIAPDIMKQYKEQANRNKWPMIIEDKNAN